MYPHLDLSRQLILDRHAQLRATARRGPLWARWRNALAGCPPPASSPTPHARPAPTPPPTLAC